MFQLLQKSDILVLPSLAEGMPVSVIEGMKAGVVPIVNNLPGEIKELVINGRTDYEIENNLADRFVNFIKQLNHDRDLLNTISKESSSLANHLFDPEVNTAEIETLILNVSTRHRQRKPIKIYGNRLDQKWVPNRIVVFLRKWS